MGKDFVLNYFGDLIKGGISMKFVSQNTTIQQIINKAKSFRSKHLNIELKAIVYQLGLIVALSTFGIACSGVPLPSVPSTTTSGEGGGSEAGPYTGSDGMQGETFGYTEDEEFDTGSDGGSNTDSGSGSGSGTELGGSGDSGTGDLGYTTGGGGDSGSTGTGSSGYSSGDTGGSSGGDISYPGSGGSGSGSGTGSGSEGGALPPVSLPAPEALILPPEDTVAAAPDANDYGPVTMENYENEDCIDEDGDGYYDNCMLGIDEAALVSFELSDSMKTASQSIWSRFLMKDAIAQESATDAISLICDENDTRYCCPIATDGTAECFYPRTDHSISSYFLAIITPEGISENVEEEVNANYLYTREAPADQIIVDGNIKFALSDQVGEIDYNSTYSAWEVRGTHESNYREFEGAGTKLAYDSDDTRMILATESGLNIRERSSSESTYSIDGGTTTISGASDYPALKMFSNSVYFGIEGEEVSYTGNIYDYSAVSTTRESPYFLYCDSNISLCNDFDNEGNQMTFKKVISFDVMELSTIKHYIVAYEDGTIDTNGINNVRLRMTDNYYYYGRFGGEDGPIGAFSNLKDIEIFQEPADVSADGAAVLLDGDNNKLYFISFNISSQTITFDESNGVTVGAAPESMLIVDDYVYTANYDDGTISQVSLTSRRLTNTIDLKSTLFPGKDFVNVRPKKLSNQGTNLFVNCENRRGVLVIDLSLFSSAEESETSSEATSTTLPFSPGPIDLSRPTTITNNQDEGSGSRFNSVADSISNDSEGDGSGSGLNNLRDSGFNRIADSIANDNEEESSGEGDGSRLGDNLRDSSVTSVMDSIRSGSEEEESSEDPEERTGEDLPLDNLRESSPTLMDSRVYDDSEDEEDESNKGSEIDFEFLRDPSATNINTFINSDADDSEENEEEETNNDTKRNSLTLPMDLRGTSSPSK